MGLRRLYKTPSPFNAGELVNCDFEQSNDAIFFAHLNHVPQQLTRAGHSDWQFADVAFGPAIDPPTGVAVTATNPNTDAGNSNDAYFPRAARYVVASVDDDTGQVSLPSSAVSATNDLSLKRNYNRVTWSSSGADRYFVYKANLDGSFGWIGETTSLQFTDDNITPDLSDGPRVGRNPFTGTGNYPSTVFFFEQRLGWARTFNDPNAMFLSRSADLFNLDVSRPVTEDDAITIRLVATKVNAINQVVPLSELLILGSNGLFKVVGANQDYLAASPPPRQRKQSSRGASRLEPVVVDDVVFYTPAIGDGVRSAGYSFEIDGIKSDDVAIYSPHFFAGHRIKSWAYAEDPFSTIWAVRDDGKLLCFTWEREHEVWGWTLCETQGIYLDVAVIPEVPRDADGKTIDELAEHRVYFLVERVIDGVRRRFVERQASAKWEDQKDALFLDCALSFFFDPPASRAYVPHLAGATVDMLFDGNVGRNILVGEDGYAEIPNGDTAQRVHVGLAYSSLIETLPLAMPSRDGGARAGKVKLLGKAVLRMLKTRGVRTGVKANDLIPLKTRRNETVGAPKDLLSGDYIAEMEPVASLETNLFVSQENPLPMQITAIFLDPIETED